MHTCASAESGTPGGVQHCRSAPAQPGVLALEAQSRAPSPRPTAAPCGPARLCRLSRLPPHPWAPTRTPCAGWTECRARWRPTLPQAPAAVSPPARGPHFVSGKTQRHVMHRHRGCSWCRGTGGGGGSRGQHFVHGERHEALCCTHDRGWRMRPKARGAGRPGGTLCHVRRPSGPARGRGQVQQSKIQTTVTPPLNVATAGRRGKPRRAGGQARARRWSAGWAWHMHMATDLELLPLQQLLHRGARGLGGRVARA